MDELHFGRAAARLQMAQPPLSRAIRKLEDSLGVQLLVRSSRAVAPTEAGRVFAEEARKVLASVDQAISAARHAGGASTELRIGCMLHMRPDLLHRFLGGLTERDPDITAQVTHVGSLEQVRRLRAGELDLGIYIDAGEQPDIETEPLFPGEILAAFVAQSHPLAANEVIRPADVEGETLIIFPRAANPALHDRARALADDAGYRFRYVLEATSSHARDGMVLAGQGRGVYLAFESLRDEAGPDRHGLAIRPLEPELRLPDTRLAWAPRTPDTAGTRLEAAREVAHELYAAATSMA